MDPVRKALLKTAFFDYDHPAVEKFVSDHAGEGSPREQVVKLYYAVRDGIRYDPYTFTGGPETMKASFCLIQNAAYCVPKAVLLGAAARAIGIPSRLGLADVRNHLASPRLLEWLRTDVFTMHGYVEMLIEGKWVKATPAFNKELCEKFGVPPLEFNGVEDSLFQRFGEGGREYMEYIRDYRSFDDVPADFIVDRVRKTYPHLELNMRP
jgi:transglutaminase-like putative cysteine protease